MADPITLRAKRLAFPALVPNELLSGLDRSPMPGFIGGEDARLAWLAAMDRLLSPRADADGNPPPPDEGRA